MLTVDLSGADFEAYYAPFLAKPLSSDVDTPAPNLEVISYFGTDMIFDNPGRYSYILFKADAKTKVKDLPQYPYPTKSTPSSKATKYYQIPTSLILDAVEVTKLRLAKCCFSIHGFPVPIKYRVQVAMS